MNDYLDGSATQINVGGEQRTVVVSNTPGSRSRGLGGQDVLTNDGMLFVYDSDMFIPFSAKELRFPVLLAFYDKDGQFISAQRLEPGWSSPVWPERKFRYALEIPEDRFVPGPMQLGV